MCNNEGLIRIPAHVCVNVIGLISAGTYVLPICGYCQNFFPICVVRNKNDFFMAASPNVKTSNCIKLWKLGVEFKISG